MSPHSLKLKKETHPAAETYCASVCSSSVPVSTEYRQQYNCTCISVADGQSCFGTDARGAL
jgi:hypothetical protein